MTIKPTAMSIEGGSVEKSKRLSSIGDRDPFTITSDNQFAFLYLDAREREQWARTLYPEGFPVEPVASEQGPIDLDAPEQPEL